MSVLYVIATPIGNLSDITLRALEVLKEVEYAVCENPAVSKRLFIKYQIPFPKFIRYREKDNKKIPLILNRIKDKKAAFLVNSGTPAISDPGSKLVAACREAGFKIFALPGPCAFVAALSVSGISTSHFEFLGFLPKKQSELLKLFEDLARRDAVAVAYQSPHRLEKTLLVIAEYFPNLKIFLAKELTKFHEETKFGKADELLEYIKTGKRSKGEFVLVFDFRSK